MVMGGMQYIAGCRSSFGELALPDLGGRVGGRVGEVEDGELGLNVTLIPHITAFKSSLLFSHSASSSSLEVLLSENSKVRRDALLLLRASR